MLILSGNQQGDTVLYLGDTEVRLTTKGTTKTLTGTRYYTAAGQTIALRTATAGVTGSKLSFLAGDHHGTSSLVLDATTMAVTKRHTTPFGAPRGTTPATWPDDKAFLGKPADTTTGLTHIGAREYDPTIGQFISVDPLLELDKHQTLNGYTYGAQNPVTFSDPTGMGLACGRGGDGCPDDGDPMPETADSDGNGLNYGGTSGSDGPAPTGSGRTAWPKDIEPNYKTGEVFTPGTLVRKMGPQVVSILSKLLEPQEIEINWDKIFPKPKNLTKAQWEQAVESCRAATGLGEGYCRKLPVFVVDGKRTPKIAINDMSAIDAGHPSILHYAANEKQKKQNREFGGCLSAWQGPQSCDEYPFASTFEGGLGAQTMGVPESEQRIQGTDLSAFLRSNKLKRGDEFLVFVINVRRVNGVYIAG